MLKKFENDKYIAYELYENYWFAPMDFKSLLTKENTKLLDCVKIMVNGHIRFLYPTENKKNLEQLFQTMSPKIFQRVVRRIVGIVLELRENGILKSYNLDLSEDKIFIDENTGEIYLVYLPITGITISDAEFDEELRRKLILWTNRLLTGSGNAQSQLALQLADDSKSLKDLYRQWHGEKEEPVKELVKEPEEKILVLSPLDENGMPVFEIDQDEYFMGRKKSEVDGHIPGNLRIGRLHCKIVRKNQKFYVQDLDSKNSTFLNAVKILPNEPYALNDGMILRLADVSFAVSFKERTR